MAPLTTTTASLVVAVMLVLTAATHSTSAYASMSLSIKDDTRELIELGQFVFGNENIDGPSGGSFTVQLSKFSVDDGSPYINSAKLVAPLKEPIGIIADKVENEGDAAMRLKTARRAMASSKVCYINDETFAPRVSSIDPPPPSSVEGGAVATTGIPAGAQSLRGRYVFPINGLNVDTIASESVSVTFSVREPGLYVFYFYNCRGLKVADATSENEGEATSSPPPSSPSVNAGFSLSKRMKMPPVTVTAEISAWNIDSSGYIYYLPGNQQSLPFWYSFFAVLFTCGGVMWFRILRKNSQFVIRLHQGLLLLVFVKILTLTFEALRYSHYKSTGHESMWTFLYYFALCIKGVLLFSSLVLIGAGWSIVKSSINDQEKLLLKLLIPAQIILNICQVILDETSKGNTSWGYAQDILLFLDMLCCLAVLVPLFTSMKNLQEVVDSQDEKTVRVISQLKMLRSIYFAIVIYLYSSRVLIRLLVTVAPYYLMGWMGPVLMETIAIVFYTYLGYMLQPSPLGTFSPLAAGARQEVDTMMRDRREIGRESA